MVDSSFFSGCFKEAAKVAQEMAQSSVILEGSVRLCHAAVKSLAAGGKILICGNGGSHADALHFAEELTGRYQKDRRALGAIALGEAAHMSCVGNDYGFEFVFSRQLEALGKKEDLLIVLSTSGNSKNVLNALETARRLGIGSFALLGKDGGSALKCSDDQVVFPGSTTDRIQEGHMLMLHSVIEGIERQLFPENYR